MSSYDAALHESAERYMASRYGGPSGKHVVHVERDLDTVEGTTVCYSVEVSIDEGFCAESGRIVDISGEFADSPLCMSLGSTLTLTDEERSSAAEDFAVELSEASDDRY